MAQQQAAKAPPLWLLVTLSQLIFCGAHYFDPRVKTFAITVGVPSQQEQQVAVLGSNGQRASCMFYFTTTTYEGEPVPKEEPIPTTPAPSPPQAPAPAGSLQSALASLHNKCIHHKIGYWDYEICMGGRIRQYHGNDEYVLGMFDRWDGNRQLYAKGQGCEGSPKREPRRVQLVFGCPQDKRSLFLAKLEEPSMCQYVMTVATPLACPFGAPVVAAKAQKASLAAAPAKEAVNAHATHEDWFLHLAFLADGRFSCSVYTNELRATGSKLAFASAQLSLQVDNIARPTGANTAQFLARREGRVDVEEAAVSVRHTDRDAQRRTVLATTAHFDGRLALLKIFA